MIKEELPEVQLYGIGPEEADHADMLLTSEAVTYIKNGEAFGMALVEDGEARAAACVRFSPENEAILEIISFYVAPEFRRRGLGGTLLMELLEEAMAATDGSLYRVSFEFMPEMDGLETLFQKAGFQIETDEHAGSWRLPLKDLPESPLIKRQLTVPDGYLLRTLGGLSDITIRQLAEELKRNEVGDLSAADIQQTLQLCSYVLLDAGMTPKACAILSEQGEGSICLSQFFVAGGSAADGIPVLQAAAKALVKQFPEQTMLEIPTLTDSSAKLVQKLLPTGKVSHMMQATLDF